MFLAPCFKYCSPGLPTAFLLDIAPSRMFTTNSLCLTVCPIRERLLIFKTFLLSPFEKLHHSLFYLSNLFLTFPSSSTIYAPFSFPPTVHVPDPQTATLQIRLCISFLFISKLKLFEQSRSFSSLNITLAP